MEYRRPSPEISVIIPAYNAQDHIEATIRSVQEQTFTDWELIVVDDGSEDRTAEIIRNMACSDSRIRFIANERNRGVAFSRNRGIDTSKGRFIAFLDADDLWRAQKLEKQLELAAQTGAEIIYCSYALIDSDSKPCGRDFLVSPSAGLKRTLWRSELSCSTVLIRASALKSLRFEEDQPHEDLVLWLRLFQSGCRAAGIREVLAEYRVMWGTRSADKSRSAANRWHVYRNVIHLGFLPSCWYFIRYCINGLIKYM